MKWMTPKALLSLFSTIFLTLALVCISGCKTHQVGNVETSGFLKDYSQLREGTGDEAVLTYTNPKVDFRQYNKILLDPIRVYPGVGDSVLRPISSQDMQKLLNYFDATLRNSLGKNYTFVTKPGPGTMRFRIALTEADSGKVALDIMSSVLPPAIALSALKTVVTGSGTGVGGACAEFEAVDSVTGKRLAAAVDKRVGGKYTGEFDKLNQWRGIQGAFDYWAERLNVRLAELRKTQPSAGR
jgi:hypothetical protein